MTQKIDITTASFLRLVAIVFGIWFLFLVRDIIVLLFIVFLVVAGLEPMVHRLSRYLTRVGATVVVFLMLLALISLFTYIMFPPLISELQQFSSRLPEYVTSLSNGSQGHFLESVVKLVRDNINSIVGQFGNVGSIVVDRTLGVFDGLVAAVTVLVLTFYLLVGEDSQKHMLRNILPKSAYDNLNETIDKITKKLGQWVRGQLLLMLFVGVLTYIGLSIIHTPYALALAVLAGLLEIIPIIGPWVTALIAMLIGLTISPLQALIILIVCIAVQQLEGHILVPKVMSQAVGLNPVIVITSLLIGATLYGVAGTLLAVPVAAIVSVIVEDWELIKETFSEK